MVEDLSWSGRADRIYISGDTALIIDFKSGFSEPVSADLNAQLKVLAVLVAIKWRTLKSVYVQIISGAHGISEHRYDVAGLYAAYQGIITTRRKLSEPGVALNPGEAQCRYCPAGLICPALKALSVSVSKIDFNVLPDGVGAAQLLDRIVLLIDYLEEIRAYYRNRLRVEPDYSIPGYCLESGPPRRNVTDWVKARERLLEFIDQKDLDKLVLYSIPATEALLGKAIGVRGKMLRDQYARILGEVLELKTPEPTLKRT